MRFPLPPLLPIPFFQIPSPPDLLFLSFPSEKGKQPRNINQTLQIKHAIKIDTSSHMEADQGHQVGGNRSQKVVKGVRHRPCSHGQ